MDLDLLGLFRKGITRIIANFLRTDLVICGHSREGEIPSYSRINTVVEFANSIDPYLNVHCLPPYSYFNIKYLGQKLSVLNFSFRISSVIR